MNEKRNKWLEKSYAIVAENGMEYLTINSISREVGKSKSSFYHFFVDLEHFKKDLIDYHKQQVNLFSLELEKVENFNPNLIYVFLEHKVDIFFHKQLRIHRIEPMYKNCIEEVFESYENSLLEQWALHFELNHQKKLAKKMDLDDLADLE